MGARFSFREKVWLYSGNGAWHFVSLPKDMSAEIRDLTQGVARGWGAVRVEVRVGDVVWQTSIFPDKGGFYLLPLKASVRKELGIVDGDELAGEIELV